MLEDRGCTSPLGSASRLSDFAAADGCPTYNAGSHAVCVVLEASAWVLSSLQHPMDVPTSSVPSQDVGCINSTFSMYAKSRG